MIGLQKLGNYWYTIVCDESLDEVYHIRMPESWKPSEQEVLLIVPPTEQ